MSSLILGTVAVLEIRKTRQRLRFNAGVKPPGLCLPLKQVGQKAPLKIAFFSLIYKERIRSSRFSKEN